eukprot:TRINITY_DN41036_c0_g1_i1.p1 TRINITY_DN41036_c0_g1~~TRINITY_DN41036_c0_g1_i1.p1  ORF type:complete len:221 (+),score=44.41 TRINITY_DN41036_c0_g1_i1:139-801(+)
MMSSCFVAFLLVQSVALSHGAKIHSHAPAFSAPPHQEQRAIVAAAHEAASSTATKSTSWFDKFRLAFGAPHHQEAAHTSFLSVGVDVPLKVKSLLSQFKLTFGAPKHAADVDVRVSQMNSVTEAAHVATSFLHRLLFGAPHRKERSFLQLHEAVAPTVQAASTGSKTVVDKKVQVKGDYVMGAGLRIFYVVLTVVLILITLASCAWLYKETPGSQQVQEE